MKVYHKNIEYDTIYSPFFRIEYCEDFSIYGLRYPSGRIEDVIVFDRDNYIVELKQYLEYILREYGLEEDSMLTERAKELKNDVRELFGINR